MEPAKLPPRALALAIAVATIWGLTFVVARIGLDTIPPTLLSALRFGTVSAVGVWFVPRPQVSWLWIVVVGLCLGVGQFGLQYLAIDQGMPAGLAAVVMQAQAGFSALFAAIFLNERPSRTSLVGLGIAGSGLAVLAVGVNGVVSIAASALAVAAAASWGLGNIAIRKSKTSDGLGMVVWASLISPLPLIAMSLVIDGPEVIAGALLGIGIGEVLIIGYLAVLATFFGFGTWYSLISRHGTTVIAPFSLLGLPVALLSAWLLLDEQPTPMALTGSLLVLVGLAYPHVRRRQYLRRGSGINVEIQPNADS